MYLNEHEAVDIADLYTQRLAHSYIKTNNISTVLSVLLHR